MLSRAAERVYWAGRYLERAENMARIVQQHSQLLLDLPSEVGVDWYELIKIFGAGSAFRESGAPDDEHAILEFLLADVQSGSSLSFCIKAARDNIRNSRDLLPQESWEAVNELHVFARRQLSSTANDENRFEVLSDCIGRCQQINGILAGTMSHESPFQFLMLGQSLERADMLSRIIDVAAAYLQQNEHLVLRYGSTLWTNVLKSVSGFQMYRQYSQPAVVGLSVIDYLLNDQAFPRAVRACLEQAKSRAILLPRNEEMIIALEQVQKVLPSTLTAGLDGAGVSLLMDTLQKRLAAAHDTVVTTWFLTGDEQ